MTTTEQTWNAYTSAWKADDAHAKQRALDASVGSDAVYVAESSESIVRYAIPVRKR